MKNSGYKRQTDIDNKRAIDMYGKYKYYMTLYRNIESCCVLSKTNERFFIRVEEKQKMPSTGLVK